MHNAASRFLLNRRQFLQLGISAGAGLVIGVNLSACQHHSKGHPEGTQSFKPNLWLEIGADNKTTIFVSESEMGQGVLTSIAMLIAEELDARWELVKVKQAPIEPIYGFQYTGGSTTIKDAWDPLRKAGAAARQMLITAASIKWGVPEGQCTAKDNEVLHISSGRTVPYGELSHSAGTLPVPAEVTLKKSEEFTLIGSDVSLVDIPMKINGSAVYGIDVQVPDLHFATIAHCPVFGGQLKSFNAAKAKQVSGVTHVIRINAAVAVVATSYWAASKALSKLEVIWDSPKKQSVSTLSIKTKLKDALNQPGETVYRVGDAKKLLEKSDSLLEASYESPLQAQVPMEPIGCTAYVHDGKCDVWVSTQVPTQAKNVAAKYRFKGFRSYIEEIRKKVTGERSLQDINVNLTYLGGGFGRRLEQDYVAEAVQISREVQKPIKLIWSREEDIRHGFYRPTSYEKLTAAVDKSGKPLAIRYQIAGLSKAKSIGAIHEFPYDMAHLSVEYVDTRTTIPIGSWRSVGSSLSAFSIESFIDELAVAAGQDPLEYRLALLQEQSLHSKVLQKAAEISAWREAKNDGRFMGIALYPSAGTSVAQVVEVSVNDKKHIKVDRVICVIDCGIVVNPKTVRAQVEGSVVFALTAALKGNITVQDSRVQQSNFHDYPILRMNETPQIDVHIVASERPPTGVGEPGVPPLAPALANAVFAATGVRLRELPLRI